MAEIKEFKEFVQIGKNTYIALGDATTKLQTLPDFTIKLLAYGIKQILYRGIWIYSSFHGDLDFYG